MASNAHVVIGSDSDIVLAREHGRRIGKEMGFPVADLTRIATGISEIARNIVTYAETGEISINAIERETGPGIEITAEDKGPGIQDIPLAMSDGYSTVERRGLGLPGVRRLMDEFELTSSHESGTIVKMRKWVIKVD